MGIFVRDLFPYQQDAVNFAAGKQSILVADEMGLGKTTEALAIANQDSGDHRILVIAPNAIKLQWIDEIQKCLPGLPTVALRRTSLALKNIPIPDEGVFIVNWEALHFMPQLKDVSWDWIIADEAHKAKNRNAKRTKALKMLTTRRKLALTATPMANRPDELWSILNWMYPRVFTSYWKFYENFVEYITSWGGFHEITGVKNGKELSRLLHRVMIRRRIEDVIKDVIRPKPIYIPVVLGPKERRAYDDMAKTIKVVKKRLVPAKAYIGEDEDEYLEARTVLAQLTRLRQFAGAYAKLNEDDRVRLTEPSAKLDAAMEIIENTDQPIVVLTMFKDLVYLLAKRLSNAKISYAMYTGNENEAAKATAKNNFMRGTAKVFVATIQSIGLGVDGLQVAPTFLFLDRSWSPLDNEQAEGRSRFHLQNRPVNFIYLLAEGTVDKYVDTIIQTKKSWFIQVVEGTL